MASSPPLPELPPFERLVRVIERLRAPEGCPWDREQNVASLRRGLLLEAYEALEALEGDDAGAALEELGDLQFQIAFLAQLFAERQAFGLDDVARSAAEKMIARHPHVFGEERLASAESVANRWRDLKAAARGESPGARSALDGIPRALPALQKAHELQSRAAREGFDWTDVSPVLAKLLEELEELREAMRGSVPERVAAELGDVLFTVANLSRKLGQDPEAALEQANRRFDARFRFIEERLRAAGRRPRDASLAELDALWDEAKRREG